MALPTNNINPYQIEQCRVYRRYPGPKNQEIYVFEGHNMAFPVWGTIASRSQKCYRLISFDHHTDTHEPFSSISRNDDFDRNLLRKLNADKATFDFESAFRIANLLRNDEQIKAACRYGYISSYLVICDLDEAECVQYQKDDCETGYVGAEYCARDNAETLLAQKTDDLLGCSLIIDFDLDFFRSNEDFSSGLFETIVPLVEASDVITIATEPLYFNDLRIDDEFSLEMALDLLLNRIEAVF